MKAPRIKSIISFVFCLALIAPIAIHCFADKTPLNVHLSTVFGFAQFFAFPILFGTVGFCCSAGIVILLIYRSKLGGRFSRRVIFPWMLLSIFFAVFIMLGNNPTRAAVDKSGKSLKLVEWNAAGSLSAENAKTIFLDFDADIAVFPELGNYSLSLKASDWISDTFSKAGIDIGLYDIFTHLPIAGGIAPVTVIVKKSFASYQPADGTSDMTLFGTVYLSSVTEGIPDIIALHTSPPLPGMMTLWSSDIDLTASLSDSHANALIAGDFNATLRHGSLNNITQHYDALESISPVKRGTWPAKFPPSFRSSIDHVLLPDSCSVKSAEVKTLNGSDHAAIFLDLIISFD